MSEECICTHYIKFLEKHNCSKTVDRCIICLECSQLEIATADHVNFTIAIGEHAVTGWALSCSTTKAIMHRCILSHSYGISLIHRFT